MRGSPTYARLAWDDRFVQRLVEYLRVHHVFADAVAAFSRELGRPVSIAAATSVLRNRLNARPADFLRRWGQTIPDGAPPPATAAPIAPPVPPRRPLSAHEEIRDEEPPAPERHPVEEREEREELTGLRRKVAKLVEELRVANARHAFLGELNASREPPTILPRERRGVREMTAVVLASDWHVEAEVDPASVSGRNAFDLDVADRRIRRFFDEIAWNVEHHRASGQVAINELVLWLGGDLINGYIHPELVESNNLSPTRATLWLLPRLRDGIYTLLRRLDVARIVVPCSYGNHGRLTDRTRISTGYANSLEWLTYHHLAEELRSEPRVVFEITPSAHQYVKVYGFTLHFHHGDQIKYQGGVGGIGIPLLKRVPLWDLIRHADVHNIGHWHQLRDYGRAVVNGSLIGYDSYAMSIGAAFEPPQQALYFVDSVRGKCMLTSLWLEGHDEAFAA